MTNQINRGLNHHMQAAARSLQSAKQYCDESSPIWLELDRAEQALNQALALAHTQARDSSAPGFIEYF